jgi:putative ABC transport system substrate-binding protein
MPDTANGNAAQALIDFGLAHNLPVAGNSHGQADMGCLFAYSDANFETGQMAARLVDKILKGAAPADLPVETAEAYLTVNMQTAAAIGLDMPGEILRMAGNIIHND